MMSRVERERIRLAQMLHIPALVLIALASPNAAADICGCQSSPDSLGTFDTTDPTKFAGVTPVGGVFTFPLPPDGVLIFDEFVVSGNPALGCPSVRFARNDANTPVTLLVRGNLTVQCGNISVSGGNAGDANEQGNGGGGMPGPGGFAGGEGAHQASNGATIGGSGIGPAGGAGATLTSRPSGGGLLSVPELRPIAGGSGGGGGASRGPEAYCAGGGGGGGGGALVVAVNGTATINGEVFADGGRSGNTYNSGCGSAGASGGGGAIRLLAGAMAGTGGVYARGGDARGFDSEGGNPGRIRMEATQNSFVGNTSPVALRAPFAGPLVGTVVPRVVIAAIDGMAPPSNPQGYRGMIDITIASPHVVAIDLQTTDVPAGTIVDVDVKAKVGDDPTPDGPYRVTLDPANCTSGVCAETVLVDLAPGAYILESRATFEVE